MKRNEHVEKIIGFYHARKRMPSYREIMRLTGFKSTNAVYKFVEKLVAANLVKKDGQSRLIPTGLMNETPVLGRVEAGFPSPAEEELVDTMSIDEYLIENREATYLLKVSGDSMIGAGIMAGDLVLVERKGDARDGEIVIAEVDHKWTMKYLRKKSGRIFLEAANEKYKPIIPKEELKIAAVVKAVIRKY